MAKKTAAIIPFEEWEKIEKAKELFEYIYLSELIKERKDSPSVKTLDDLLDAEGLTRAEMEC